MLKKLSPYHYALLSKRLGEYHYTPRDDGTHPLREEEPVLDRWIELLNLKHEEVQISCVSELLRAVATPLHRDEEGTAPADKDPMVFLIHRLIDSQHRIDWQAYVDFYHGLAPTDQDKIEAVFKALMAFDHAEFLNPRDPVWTIPEQMHDLSRSATTILLNTEKRAERIQETLRFRVCMSSYYQERDEDGDWCEAIEIHLIGVAATVEAAIEIAVKGIQKFVLVRYVDELRPTILDSEVISGICGSPETLWIEDSSDTTAWPVREILKANVGQHLVHNAGDEFSFHLSLDWVMPPDELELPAAIAEKDALEKSLEGDSPPLGSWEAVQQRLEDLRSTIQAADNTLQCKQTLIDTLEKVSPAGVSQLQEYDHGL